MHRFYVDPADLTSTTVTITGESLHHLAVVLRLGSGVEILLLDGQGKVCHCRLLRVGRKEAEAEVLKSWLETEGVLPLRLLQGVPKGERMELVLQKGTELGISAFTPVVSERSIGRIDGVREEKRQLRWQRIITEAARQSRRPLLPHLDATVRLPEALAATSETLRLMLWEGESRPLATVLPAQAPASVALLVGPEGGFSPEEAALAREHSFVAVSLGSRILRSETAGFAVAAILGHRYGDLGR